MSPMMCELTSLKYAISRHACLIDRIKIYMVIRLKGGSMQQPQLQCEVLIMTLTFMMVSIADTEQVRRRDRIS